MADSAATKLRKSVAAQRRWALASDEERQAITAEAHKSYLGRFLDQVPASVTDPEKRLERARILHRAYMRELAINRHYGPSKATKPPAVEHADKDRLREGGQGMTGERELPRWGVGLGPCRLAKPPNRVHGVLEPQLALVDPFDGGGQLRWILPVALLGE
jgi:hypothetical protein